jgi:hypothetical protein
MKSLLKLLLLTTILLPVISGTVAVLSGFDDPWGMGNKDAAGIFVTAALPILPPGLYQILSWPLTYGVAILISPLLFINRRYYLITVLLYLAVISFIWLLGWKFYPDTLNTVFDRQTVVPGHLNRGVWKFGVYLLTDAGILAAAVCRWFRRAYKNNN